MTRTEIKNLIEEKENEIKDLRKSIYELRIKAYQLCDEEQTYEENMETVIVSKRPKVTKEVLRGKIFFNEKFYDEDTGEAVIIRRQQIVREDDKWLLW